LKNTHIIKPSILSETGSLKYVILGIPNDFGGIPNVEDCYDPSSIYYLKNNLFPKQSNITKEMNAFLEVLEKYNVVVLRPENIKGLNQVFSRDLGFVIGDTLIISNVIDNRSKEIPAIKNIIDRITNKKVLNLNKELIIEGGDVCVTKGHVFIGFSKSADIKKYKVARTNHSSVDFISNKFPNFKVMGFELFKSDQNKDENTLHLDCCFQPIGNQYGIIAPESFKNKSDINYLENLFGKSNLFYLTKSEKNIMSSNIFSISETVVVSDSRFKRLNNWLRKRNFSIEEINYSEVSKMGGLFRCSTLPLIRE
jgi:N-dimethylarginine dimethylaminohydrolase